MQIKTLLKELTPPILWKALKRLQTLPKVTDVHADRWEFGVEQPAEFYDEKFKKVEQWKQHYSLSHYYPVWTVIVDRLKREAPRHIVDVGCGPGQLACLLRDQGLPSYLGLDFSAARIEFAQTICPEYRFETADVFQSQLLRTEPYDAVVLLEFLEHVNRDLEVLEMLRPDTYVLGTVPNFPAAGHVRHFASAEDVSARYSSCFSKMRVDSLTGNPRGATYFLIEGRK
jgi:trans-aconitate methyltransferase